MSRRSPIRLRIDDLGRMEVVDPGWECQDLLISIDPEFKVHSTPLTEFRSPRFLGMRQTGSGFASKEIAGMSLHRLWEVHRKAMDRFRVDRRKPLSRDEATLLDLKIELARRMLSCCRLCGHRCGVNRLVGQKGTCLLGTEDQVAEHFVHIAEEPPINPSMLLSLAGCALRCRFCQQGRWLTPDEEITERLVASLWGRLDSNGARSLSFAGGNPDESVYAVLRFLLSAPDDWALPIVWNCHCYSMPETVMLLDGVVDVWLPDFKYGDPLCGWHLSGVKDYPQIALAAVASMLGQNVPVIVRLLVLPGHLACCHIPVLELLTQLPGKDRLQISVRGQYCPDWKIDEDGGAMNRRPTVEEVRAVEAKADELGFMMVYA